MNDKLSCIWRFRVRLHVCDLHVAPVATHLAKACTMTTSGVNDTVHPQIHRVEQKQTLVLLVN